TRFEPCPYQIEAYCIDAEAKHLGKILLNRRRIPLVWPLHACFSWHPIHPNRNKAFAISGEIISIHSNGRQRRCFFSSCLSRRRGCSDHRHEQAQKNAPYPAGRRAGSPGVRVPSSNFLSLRRIFHPGSHFIAQKKILSCPLV